jgi:hypothetical protein
MQRCKIASSFNQEDEAFRTECHPPWEGTFEAQEAGLSFFGRGIIMGDPLLTNVFPISPKHFAQDRLYQG